MAIYEFDCATCGERFEVNRPMSEHDRLKQTPPSCPKCGAADTHERVPLVSTKTPSG
jgi:putative FmdB family regulatory protein